MDIWMFVRMYKDKNPSGHFFDRDTLKFFGERMSEMRVLEGVRTVKDWRGNEHKAYCLSTRQRPPFGQPFRKHFYFDVETMEDIMMP